MEFEPFQKIARLSRNCMITEKIDGTNACVVITEDGQFLTGSRTRWITPDDDNAGFSRANGSQAAPGFMQPEGIIIYQTAARQYFKKTLDKDEEWKGKQAA